MNCYRHHTNNDALRAPNSWDQAQLPCSALPVTRTECDGIPAVVSYWRPTENELAILAAGGSIALWVIGSTMPPVMLAVDAQ